jgi:hypothetical protein
MSTPCDGIWSDDKDFWLQKKVRVWTTKDIIKLGKAMPSVKGIRESVSKIHKD